MTDPAPILAAYQKARSRAERGSASRWPGVFQSLFKKPQESQDGFLPVLIAAGEDSPLEGFEWLKGETPEEYRQKLLSQPVEDGRTLLTRMAAQRKEFAAENDWDWPGEDVLGPMEGGEAIDHFLGISDFHGKTIPLVLAEIPVQHPWEVFAYVPFGGWNECPSSQEHMAAAKYWYEVRRCSSGYHSGRAGIRPPRPGETGGSHGSGFGAVRFLPGYCGPGLSVRGLPGGHPCNVHEMVFLVGLREP